MYKAVEIKEGLYYVGVNDRTKSLFENLWPLPKGISYNSYIIDDDKVALIDTVDVCYSEIYFRKIKALLRDKPIDYLVVNHMEPDHSGAIEWMVNQYPDITIIGNNRTGDMLKGYYGITKNVLTINDKAEIKLGKNTLRFYLTPMIHWPETMMTYVPELKTLFSGDAFGTFGSLDGGVMDSQLNPDGYFDEMIRYYSNIVGKYGPPVQAALTKLVGIDIEVFCSTHGPVWTEKQHIEKVIALYDKLSKYEADKGLVIAYGSMYGNTEQLAEVIAASAAENGIKNIVMHHVAKSHQSDILRDVFKYRGLIIGSPTYNNQLYPGIESLIAALRNRNIKNRLFAYFGGFSWADATLRHLREFAEEMGVEVVCDPVSMKHSLNADVVEKARKLGQVMAEKLNC